MDMITTEGLNFTLGGRWEGGCIVSLELDYVWNCPTG